MAATPLDLTFKQIAELIKKDSRANPAILNAADQLLGALGICSALTLDPTTLAALPTVAVKTQLISIGRSLHKWLVRDDADHLQRFQRLQIAYGLLVYSAFFDALDASLPEGLRTHIGLLASEKLRLARDATVESGGSSTTRSVDPEAALMECTFVFPGETLTVQCARHAKLWHKLTNGFSAFVQKLSAWEAAHGKERLLFQEAIKELPKLTAERFEAQYVELAHREHEFAVWANLAEHRRSQYELSLLSAYVLRHGELLRNAGDRLDVGFAGLQSAIEGLPVRHAAAEAEELALKLSQAYTSQLKRSIVPDRGELQENTPQLVFPTIADAYVPQSYQVLRHRVAAQRLENLDTWRAVPCHEDLSAFLVSYLTSPYSIEAPLLILGDPGSGKSLLTITLAARLTSEHFTVIRVPLREVKADASVIQQIEEAVQAITHIDRDRWYRLSPIFKRKPPVIIFDGYDELLQASGQVFGGYLRDVQTFQEDLLAQGIPVRVVVTSRLTLINKAKVPIGSTVLRLLDFDRRRCNQWIQTWNRANEGFFATTGVASFALPDSNSEQGENILSLAKQPLLLLMLAIYDSGGNQLNAGRGLNRTKLYDRLLRRFVEREQRKERSFLNADGSHASIIVDREMKRLGVAALGMYNRRQFHILSNQLNADLKFFGVEREARSMTDRSGPTLSQAELLLGSFFFIHRSAARFGGDGTGDVAAFEFLHNTFGEFLTADLILNQARAEIDLVLSMEGGSELLKTELNKRLLQADSCSKDWMESLIHTPLFTRPWVLEFMRDWAPQVIPVEGEPAFAKALDRIVYNELNRLLCRREMPTALRGDNSGELSARPLPLPLLGHAAIYSLNLVLLRLMVVKDPFSFDEERLGSYEDGTTPWDRLGHLWRSWFNVENLNALSAFMRVERRDKTVLLRTRKRFVVPASETRLQRWFNVSAALGDRTGAALSGTILAGSEVRPFGLLEQVFPLIEDGMREIRNPAALIELAQLEDGAGRRRTAEYLDCLRQVMADAAIQQQPVLRDQVIASLRRVFGQRPLEEMRSIFRCERGELTRRLPPEVACSIVRLDPDVGLRLIQCIVPDCGAEWSQSFRTEFRNRVFRQGEMADVVDSRPSSWPAWFAIMETVDDALEIPVAKRVEELVGRIGGPVPYLETVRRTHTRIATMIRPLLRGGENVSRIYQRALINYLTHQPRLLEDLVQSRSLHAIELLASLEYDRTLLARIAKAEGGQLHDVGFISLSLASAGLAAVLRSKATPARPSNNSWDGDEVYREMAKFPFLVRIGLQGVNPSRDWVQAVTAEAGAKSYGVALSATFSESVDDREFAYLVRTNPSALCAVFQVVAIAGHQETRQLVAEKMSSSLQFESATILAAFPMIVLKDLRNIVRHSNDVILLTRLDGTLRDSAD